MESIRILQDAYEKLYALTEPVANLLERELTKVSDWKQKCDYVLSRRNCKVKEWNYFYELDLYYLLVLLEAGWEELERNLLVIIKSKIPCIPITLPPLRT